MSKIDKEVFSKRIEDVRGLMRANRVDGYIIPMSDPHGSEMLDAHYHEISFLTGFTGSAGDVFLTDSEAFLWTDNRYFLQAADQLPPEIKLMKLGLPETESYEELIAGYVKEGRIKVIALDMGIFTARAFARLKEAISVSTQGPIERLKNLVSPKSGNEDLSQASSMDASLGVEFVDADYVSKIWKERPAVKSEPIDDLDITITGESTDSKLSRVRKAMEKAGASHYFVSALDDIAWLFNKRGRDFPDSPLFYGYALIGKDTAQLYTLKGGNYEKIYDDLKNLPVESRLIVDYATTPCRVLDFVSHIEKIINMPSPIESMKAVKNATELQGMRTAHIKDGLALSRFIYWLKNDYTPKSSPLRESGISKVLDDFRYQSDDYMGPSFEPILGFARNGAIVHYSFSEGADVLVTGDSLLLADTGGQYATGTTDVTRTIGIGTVSQEMKKAYTSVLKAHLALARAEFTSETKGSDLDKIPKAEMDPFGYSYGHGTGHGVGHMLNVHEGPITISPKGNLPLKAGNVISNEPGVYLEGKFGVRIENLVEVVESEDGQLRFSNLTLCPYDTDVIDGTMLTSEETKQLRDYHSLVYQRLRQEAENSQPTILNDEDFWSWLEGFAEWENEAVKE